MDKIVKNFTNSQELKACADNHPTCGQIVQLMQWSGSMTFHFSMTPGQARELGAALYELADSLDAEPLTKEAA